MQYMLLVYANEQDWEKMGPAEQKQMMEAGGKVCQELTASGKFLGGSPLQPAATATTIRSSNGKKMLTDGPFAETREQLGGYCLIEAKDLDEAIGIAKRLHGKSPGAIEVRPVLETA